MPWYGSGKQNISGAGNVTTAVLKAQVIDEASYTFVRTHPTMEIANVPAAAKIGTAVTLGTVTFPTTNDCDIDVPDFTVTALTGNVSEAVLIYIETGATDAQRIPLLYINGLTITPNGGNYTFQVQGTTPFLGRF